MTLDFKAYKVRFGGIPITAFANDPNALTVPDDMPIFEEDIGADGKATLVKNPDVGGDIVVMIRPGTRDYNMFLLWDDQLRNHEGSVPFIQDSGAEPSGDNDQDYGVDGDYRPLPAYTWEDVTFKGCARGPSGGQSSFSPLTATFRANKITRTGGGAADDNVEPYPGLGGGGGGEPGTPGFGQ